MTGVEERTGSGEQAPPGFASRWGTRLLRSTGIVDRAWLTFERLRSRAVLRLAPESFLRDYNKFTYGRSNRYLLRASEAALLRFEEDIAGRFFPPPPARILVGGAGGGREAFALARRGYEVVAFDPSPPLASSLASQAAPGMRIEAFSGSFESLPVLDRVSGGGSIDVREMPPFDASLLGLCAFSHLLNDEDRIGALQQFAAVTSGPIALSFFVQPGRTPIAPHAPRPAGGILRRTVARLLPSTDGDYFGIAIGYYHLFNRAELESLVDRAGLALLHLDLEGNWCYAIVSRSRA